MSLVSHARKQVLARECHGAFFSHGSCQWWHNQISGPAYETNSENTATGHTLLSSKISTSTRTLVNSVYHGRYFDSIYPCEVRGHSPETGKARNTKGGLCLLASFLAALLHILNHESSTLSSSLISSPAALIATRFHRSVSWYTTTRHFPTWDSFLSRKCVPLISTSNFIL